MDSVVVRAILRSSPDDSGPSLTPVASEGLRACVPGVKQMDGPT